MKLLYTLKEPQQRALSLHDGENIRYCVPVDLDFDNGAHSPMSHKTQDIILCGDTILVAVPLKIIFTLDRDLKCLGVDQGSVHLCDS